MPGFSSPGPWLWVSPPKGRCRPGAASSAYPHHALPFAPAKAGGGGPDCLPTLTPNLEGNNHRPSPHPRQSGRGADLSHWEEGAQGCSSRSSPEPLLLPGPRAPYDGAVLVPPGWPVPLSSRRGRGGWPGRWGGPLPALPFSLRASAIKSLAGPPGQPLLRLRNNALELAESCASALRYMFV